MDLIWFKINEALNGHDFVKSILVNNKKLTLVKHVGKYHVFQSKCPHAGGLLANGWCTSGKLICPIHRYAYSLESGKGDLGQGDYLKKYPVMENPDGLYVGFRKGWWNLF